MAKGASNRVSQLSESSLKIQDKDRKRVNIACTYQLCICFGCGAGATLKNIERLVTFAHQHPQNRAAYFSKIEAACRCV